MSQLAATEGHAKPGEVVLSAEAAMMLGDRVGGVSLDNGALWLKWLLSRQGSSGSEASKSVGTPFGCGWSTRQDVEKNLFEALTPVEQVNAYKVRVAPVHKRGYCWTYFMFLIQLKTRGI